MNELQQSRNQFIESNPGFGETKTPILLWKKFFEETGEAMRAFASYIVRPTPSYRRHLGEELVDVAFILIDMASYAQVNFEQAMKDKLDKDRKRFPPGTVMEKSDYRRRKIALGERRK